MASSEPKPQLPRRSFSLPITKPTSAQEHEIEVLYTLPSVRIISFTTSSNNSRPNSSSGSVIEEPEAGTLSWVSKYERTIAVGAFRIYRAPGSVAFLNCQNALKPILPKSQAWCVDGDSKFVLQIRPPQYWRIEVPNKTSDEISRVEELKRVLGEVLRFEKTPCPFHRHFTVELPEAPQTPVKKRPWKPVDKPDIDISPLSKNSSKENTPIQSVKPQARSGSSSPFRRRPRSPIRVESLIAALEKQSPQRDKKVQEPDESSTVSSTESLPDISDKISTVIETDEEIADNILGLSLMDPAVAGFIYEASIAPSDDGDSVSDATDDTPTNNLQPTQQPSEAETVEVDRPRALQSSSRFMAESSALFAGTSLPSKQRNKSPSPLRCSTTITESGSDVSSNSDSFHSMQSWHSPLAPPSPPASGSSSPISNPYPLENIVLPKRADHSQNASAMPLIPEIPGTWGPPESEIEQISKNFSPSPKILPLVENRTDKSEEEPFEILTQPNTEPTVRNRTTTSSNSHLRELSPLPPAETLFSTRKKRQRQPRKLQTARHLPTAIIQKTYEILISPPSHLFQLMLNIASKIAAGEWRGMLPGYGESVQWDFEDEYGEDSFEDDYGISLPNPPRSKAKRSSSAMTGGSWEID